MTNMLRTEAPWAELVNINSYEMLRAFAAFEWRFKDFLDLSRLFRPFKTFLKTFRPFKTILDLSRYFWNHELSAVKGLERSFHLSNFRPFHDFTSGDRKILLDLFKTYIKILARPFQDKKRSIVFLREVILVLCTKLS